MTYRSKISLALVLPIMLLLTSSAVIFALQGQWLFLAVFVPVIAFVLHLFLNTNYKVGQTALTIKSGLVVNKQIEISQIRSISETNNPLSSPAISLDRLEICYNRFDSIMVSPKQKTAFIAHLTRLNPAISVNLKNSVE